MSRLFKFKARRHKVVTTTYPAEPFTPPDGSMGLPVVDVSLCELCGDCTKVCPTSAIIVDMTSVSVDSGLCIFCGECAIACPKGAFSMSTKFELASRRRKDLEVNYHVR